MLCLSYCTASEYKMELLSQYLSIQNFKLQHYDDVIHLQMYDNNNLDITIFPFGCIVIWDANNSSEQLILKQIKAFEVEPTTEVVSDFIYFKYHEKVNKNDENSNSFIEEEKNRIILGSKSEHLKLSISHALAQSVKLNFLENSVNKILESTTSIQKELAKTATISLSQTELSKKIGHLFSERFSINLHSDILDTPEFFWKRPSYEPLYLMTAKFQDISVRQGILNHRLDIIQELYSILSNELNNKHSSRLEMTIIVLITFEVLLALSHNDIVSKFFNLF